MPTPRRENQKPPNTAAGHPLKDSDTHRRHSTKPAEKRNGQAGSRTPARAQAWREPKRETGNTPGENRSAAPAAHRTRARRNQDAQNAQDVRKEQKRNVSSNRNQKNSPGMDN